jgi:hypothetical protein
MINNDILAIKDSILSTVSANLAKKYIFLVHTLMEHRTKTRTMTFLWC